MQNHNPQKLFVEQLVALIPGINWLTPDGAHFLPTGPNKKCPFEVHFHTVTHKIIVSGHFTVNNNIEVLVKLYDANSSYGFTIKETTKTLAPEETIQYLTTIQDASRKMFKAAKETEYQLQRLFNEVD